ncbi:MAG: hypothetical protein Q9167_002634 [Letrouitia subvulpina]
MPQSTSNTVERLDKPSAYYLGRNKKRKFNKDRDDREDLERPAEEPEDPLKDAATLYVGNLKTPCGFCFVEYYNHQDALDCMKYIGGTKLDERIIRTDLDPGFQEGRQYGRGKSGGQVRDEYRDEYDPGRGGFGRAIAEERQREEEQYGKGR